MQNAMRFELTTDGSLVVCALGADFWGEPIYIYGDAEALADGVLVDAEEYGARCFGVLIDRVTKNCLCDSPRFASSWEAGAWDVPLREYAEEVENLAAFDEELLAHDGLWLCKNERERWTLMLPSDY